MALIQKLLLRQSQALVMTPQLMQAIKLLQLSHLDLASYVEGELERNPLLERPAEEEPPAPRTSRRRPAALAAETKRASADWMDDRLETRRQSIEERLDTDLNNVFPDDAAPLAPRGRRGPAGRLLGMGRGRAGRPRRRRCTISKPSCRRRRRLPVISPNRCR